MKTRNYISLLVALLICTASSYAQQAKLFFDTNVDCLTDKYCATIKLKAVNNTEFSVGTSSILINYNKEALAFSSYESHNFDENTVMALEGTTATLYDAHAVDFQSVPGYINTTMTLTIPGFGQPMIGSNNAVDVATVCFDILEKGANSELRFHSKHTSFDKGSTADIQLIESLDLLHAQEKLDCMQAATSIDDILAETPLSELNVTPNPFKDVINLNINAEENNDLTIQLFDVKGRMVKSENTNIFVGENGFQIEAAELPSGIYLLEVQGSDFEVSIKLLKE